MGLFSRRETPVVREPTMRPAHTMAGAPQRDPEAYGVWPRRQRLFEFVLDRLRDEPVSSADAHGRPLGDGYGMEPLVELIRPIFARERSLVPWVGLRGAIASLWQCGPPAWDEMSRAVGLTFQDDADGGRWVLASRPADMSDDAAIAVLGVHSSIMVKVANYDEIQTMSLDDVRNEHRWFLSLVNELHGYDYMVWAAVVIARLEALDLLPPITAQVPAPSALEGPGWYVDPMFAKADRYWDGNDWTSSCRTLGPGRPTEYDLPL